MIDEHRAEEGELCASVLRRIAGRYALRGVLGRGGHGEVWEAEDTLNGVVVAVKLLRPDAHAGPLRVRREVSALRLLRIPGVVQMLDEGVDAGTPFVVMARAYGEPFPGGAAKSWASLSGPTIALLETLERVHAAGVVHRDIKPCNVLVDERGRPTLLDFGLSVGPSLVRESTGDGHIVGTPAYLAPEQIVDERLTPATDLYAVGVMLYEALSGRLPHVADDFHSLMRLRLTEPPPPLSDLAPDAPLAIASAIDSLLARDPAQRPRSAADLLARLRESPFMTAAPAAPYLGDRSPIDALVTAANEGRSMDILGPRGAGRTRCLQEVAARLSQAGRDVAWIAPGKRPFSSLAAVLPFDPDVGSRKLAEVAVDIDRALTEMLQRGRVLLVDDEARLDPRSRRALNQAQSHGSILRVLDDGNEAATAERADSVTLAAWPEPILRDLFAGVDRIFHLGEDAAHELYARSEGLPARAFAELASWERAGLAQRAALKWMVGRDALERLASGQSALLRPPRLAPSDVAPPPALQQHLDALATSRNTERRRIAHRAIADALPRGADGRLFHLIAGQSEREAADSIEIVNETLVLARTSMREGKLGRATALLSEGLLAARRGAGKGIDWGEERLLGAWVELALMDGSPRAIDVVLYEICRAITTIPIVRALESLVRAALAMRTVAGDRALSMVDEIAPFSDEALEQCRQKVRVLSARRCSLAEERAVVADASRWAEGAGEEARASSCDWLGRLRYREGHFNEAAELYAKAASGHSWPTERVLAHLNAASALLEAFRCDEAADVAEEARRLAVTCRHSYGEARAEWLVRAARYRRGDPMQVDEELVELAALTGVVDLEALVCLTEAAIAWRRGEMDRAGALSRRADQRWTTMGKRWGALFARALSLAATDGEPDEWDLLVDAGTKCPVPGAGIQMLGLLASRRPEPAARLRPIVIEMRDAIPERHWRARMDVISVAEACSYFDGRAPS